MRKFLLAISLMMIGISIASAGRLPADNRAEFKKGCLNGCIGTSTHPKAKPYCTSYCDCTLNGLENAFTTEQIVNNFTRMEKGVDPEPAFQDGMMRVVNSCIDKAKKENGL